MAVAFPDVKSASGLKELDEYLLSRSYISGLVEHVLGFECYCVNLVFLYLTNDIPQVSAF